ncbi:MAG: VWA domain-containing protein [Anaerolineae bacterium]|nr:VWA domain-containing protein [Anaerolineae bacterium]
MTFSNPLALVLLLLIPYFLYLGWPRVAYRRRRDLASLLIRVAIVLCLILGLAGLQTVQAADKLSVVFLIDASDSIDQAARDQAQKFVKDSMAQMGVEDRAGIVVFGKNALVERPVSTVKEFSGITSVPIRLDSNIAEAIRLGLAMFPSDTARRIVILSDGVETLGSAVEAARLAAATNVQIDVVPLHRQQGPEVLVTDVRLPTTVNQGEIFDLGITVQSQTDTPADLTILSAGAVVQTKRVDLKAGTNNFVLSLVAPKQGFTDFQVRADVPNGSDTFYQNNELAGFTEVTGPPRILMISSKPEEIAALLPALQQTGMQVDVVAPGDLPIGLAPLAAYKSIVMANVSATDLTEQRMKVLQTYVRDLGGGLVVIGGPNSYGVGGYFQTPLEETLPVEMKIKDQKRIPRLLMVYVIDRSGSMEEIGPSGITNLELSKEATRRSLNFLFPEDRAGVLSFDSNPQWLVPIQNVRDRQEMTRLVGQLRPGGGTDILAAVSEIAKTVPSDPATLKHVILLTDGGADPAGIVDIVRQMHDKDGITVTSIGIGRSVPSFMKDISIAGHGSYYNLVDLQTIPQIFAAETVLATRSYIVEQEFTPGLTASSQIMQGINAMPALLGYVATTAKPTATVILQAPGYNDPLLAAWQYGLGRAVAWTSDATGRWAKNWTGWGDFGRYWSQVIRWTITEGANNKLEAHVEQRNGRSVLVVEARDDRGGFINSLTLNGAIIDPRLQPQPINLQQVAPGRYEAEFDPQREGAYFIRVGGSGSGATTAPISVAQTTGWVLSYSPEYRLRDTNMNLLDDVTRLTNGRILTEKPELTFSHTIREERASTALWPWLLLAVTILLPLDIAMRRVIITRSDMQKANAWVRNRLGLRGAAGAATSARMTQLKDAKVRATATMPAVGEGSPPEAPVAPTSASPGTPAAPAPKITQTAPRVEAAPKPAAPPVQPARPAPKPIQPEPAPDGSTLASRLMEKRRKDK